MTTEAPTSDPAAELAELAQRFNCQTEGCPEPFRVVSFMVGDSTAQYHCLSCWVAWNVAIIKSLTDQGLIQEPAQE